MKRTTVFLDEGLLKRMRAVARKEGRSFAAVVREAMTRYLAGGAPGTARVPGIAGQFVSGKFDTSERVDELLWKDPHT